MTLLRRRGFGGQADDRDSRFRILIRKIVLFIILALFAGGTTGVAIYPRMKLHEIKKQTAEPQNIEYRRVVSLRSIIFL
jgi:hypothetical protein